MCIMRLTSKAPHLVGCGTCCIVRCCTHVVLRELLFFPALSLNPSEESGWEEKRQRATEDGSLAVSLRGPYEISSHVLHHTHYILLFLPCLIQSHSFGWNDGKIYSHFYFFFPLLPNCLYSTTSHNQNKTKNNRQTNRKISYTYICFIQYSL